MWLEEIKQEKSHILEINTIQMRNWLMTLTVKPHYSLVTRILVDLFLNGELPTIQDITIEPQYGYAVRIAYKNGAVRLFKGSNIGINPSGSQEIVKDKGYTKYFLERLGYQTPPGKVFLLPQYVYELDKSLVKYAFQGHNTIEQIADYITSALDYPCFIKPNEGSRGKGVNKCWEHNDLEAILADYQAKHIERILVEQAVAWSEYRVVVLQDEMIACYQRRPLSIEGNGTATIKELLQRAQRVFESTQRTALIDMDDISIAQQLARKHYQLETILPEGVSYPVYEVANLSKGGVIEDYTEKISPYWRALCITVAAQMGLAFCGVDIACSNIEDAHAEYSILELNGSPGLDNYAASGEKQYMRMRMFYKKIFEAVD